MLDIVVIFNIFTKLSKFNIFDIWRLRWLLSDS
nr:MAG TPA: hypothetical protein [Microviridae sp.]